MKILNKTKKYWHVRLSDDEYDLLEKSLKKDAADKRKEAEQLEYAQWFFANHEEKTWQDEYGSWQSCWGNIHTRKTVPDPDYFTVMIYKTRFYKRK